MATIEPPRTPMLHHPGVVWSVGILSVVMLLWWAWPQRRPPQMGTSPELFQAVDALFTAVTARDEKLLTRTEQRLKTIREEGKITPGAAEYLDDVLQKAHAGSWRPAAEKLRDFMAAQRREGAEQPVSKPRKKPIRTTRR